MSIATQKFGMVPLAFLRESLTNPRQHFDEVKLQELADNIKQIGVGQPILARPIAGSEDLLEIVAGARRFRATGMADLTEIPAVVRDMTDAEVAIFQLAENLQRQDVKEMEEAIAFKRLVDVFGMSVDQICEELGVKRAYVYGRLKLMDLSSGAQAILQSGKLSASIALLIARMPVTSLHEQAAKEIVHNGGQSEPMSYRFAKNFLQNRYTLRLETAVFSIVDVKLVKTAGSCTDCPKRTGNQPDAYPDLDANVCTDPNCFEEKKTVHCTRLLADAKKNKLPIFESSNEMREAELGYEPVRPTSNLWNFERLADTTNQYDSLRGKLPDNELPKPLAYVLNRDSIPEPVYDKTAIQEALEKAGLALSIEKHDQMLRDKLASRSTGTSSEEADADRDEAIQVLETKFRVATYKAIQASAATGLSLELLRIVAVRLLGDKRLPDDLLDNYEFDTSDDEAIAAHIMIAERPEVERIMMDLIFGKTLEVGYYEINDDGTVKETEEYTALLRAATVSNVDITTIRGEIFPAPAVTESALTEAEQGVEGLAPTPTKKRGKKASAAAAPETSPLAAWPFPTSARP